MNDKNYFKNKTNQRIFNYELMWKNNLRTKYFALYDKYLLIKNQNIDLDEKDYLETIYSEARNANGEVNKKVE